MSACQLPARRRRRRHARVRDEPVVRGEPHVRVGSEAARLEEVVELELEHAGELLEVLEGLKSSGRRAPLAYP